MPLALSDLRRALRERQKHRYGVRARDLKKREVVVGRGGEVEGGGGRWAGAYSVRVLRVRPSRVASLLNSQEV